MGVLKGSGAGRRALAVTASITVVSLTLSMRAQPATPFAPLPLHVESPPDNPSTPAKVALGRLLFWDDFNVQTLVFNARFGMYLVAIAILGGIAYAIDVEPG